MFALIFKEKVVQISDKQFPVSPEMEWKKCSESVKTGWEYKNNQFKEIVKSNAEILKQKKELKKFQLRQAYIDSQIQTQLNAVDNAMNEEELNNI